MQTAIQHIESTEQQFVLQTEQEATMSQHSEQHQASGMFSSSFSFSSFISF